MGTNKIEELERQIADLERRWPPHSVPPSMLQQLEELEGELKEAEGKADAETHSRGGS